MPSNQHHKELIKVLKQQICVLRRKEMLAQARLRAALKKIGKLGKSYKTRLASTLRHIKGKIAHAQTSTYAKAALDLKRHITRGMESRGKAIKAALDSIEKQHAAKLMKRISPGRLGKMKRTTKAGHADKSR